MKVIFLEDVPGTGKVGEIKEVAEGYGRNFLIPKKLAMTVNPAAMNAVKTQIKIKARQQAQAEAELKELAKMLEGKEVNIKARAGEQERLFGSITSADISSALAASNYNVDKKKIELGEPIHQLGSYDIEIKLAKDISCKIKVNVVAEEAAAS